ncbi:MAG: extracellular solute-binding protein [Acidobacteria bacterium]|nr:extracellular solute-binding protein [Acidobacteriota bacterium]
MTLSTLLPLAACSRRTASLKPQAQRVVVYVSEDQVFSQPVLEAFQKETGIEVRAVYDTEEAKSTGVMNRLMAEKDNPQADVYWANEPIRAEVLRQRGVAEAYDSPAAEGIPATFRDPEGYWTGFSARLRVLIVNDAVEKPPRSVLDLADRTWRGKVVLANPLFGTTTSHMAALFVRLGDAEARGFLDRLKANGVRLTTSNGESADQVAAGQAGVSLVDSDDAINRVRRGDPIRMIVPDQEPGGLGCFVVPNAVVLIHGGPHPDAARRLADYLLSPDTERRLAEADCAQIPLHAGVPVPKDVPSLGSIRVMKVSYAAVARKMVEIQQELKAWAGY